MDDKDKLILDQRREIERLQAQVTRYRADRRSWKDLTFMRMYAAGAQRLVDLAAAEEPTSQLDNADEM